MSLDIGGILDDVVHQFSDPFAFLRELVQNAIDAGTGEIEIDVTFEGDDEAGVTIVTVRDFGSGMTREIIETQLCRLFSSEKHGDYTKIGRFGIGFVSVYGVEPDWVCVDTGRDGESWRIIFFADRTWELRALRDPVEGTVVQVAKSMGRAEHEAFAQRARDVLGRWCAHVRVPVRFAGVDLRQPFDIDSPCTLEFVEEGTRVVTALVQDRTPGCSYYNRGLLLRERKQSPWPHVAFKIDSRFLEHTLTRDDLLHDKGYHRAMELLEDLARKRLPALMVSELENLAHEPFAPRVDALLELLSVVGQAGILPRWRDRPIISAVDGPVSVEACLSVPAGHLFWAEERSPLALAVAEADNVVLLYTHTEPLGVLLSRRLRSVKDEWVLLAARPWGGDPRAEQLVYGLLEALHARSVSPIRVWFGSFDAPPLAVVVTDPHLPVRLQSIASPALREISGTHLVFNRTHPLLEPALAIAATDPHLAAAVVISALDPAAAGTATVAALERGSR